MKLTYLSKKIIFLAYIVIVFSSILSMNSTVALLNDKEFEAEISIETPSYNNQKQIEIKNAFKQISCSIAAGFTTGFAVGYTLRKFERQFPGWWPFDWCICFVSNALLTAEINKVFKKNKLTNSYQLIHISNWVSSWLGYLTAS